MFTIDPRRLTIVAVVVLFSVLALAACGGGGSAQTSSAPTAAAPAAGGAATLPAGDAEHGKALFTSSGCGSCHAITDQKLVGPGLAGVYAGKGYYGDKLPNKKPINEANMAEWIKIGGVGEIGQMPGNPMLKDQDLADLVAYIKTLK